MTAHLPWGRWGVLALAYAVGLLSGCGRTASSVFVTTPGEALAYDGEVHVFSVDAPIGQEIGLVEVRSVESLEAAVAELKARVAQVGGDTAVITGMTHQIGTQSVSRQESYNCGSSSNPQTCYRTVTQDQLVVTLNIQGRAIRTRSGP